MSPHSADTAQHPADTAQHPADTAQHPADTAQHPADTAQHPADTAQHPAAQRDQGAASTEWAGTLLIGALIVGLLSAAVAQAALGPKVQAAVCAILTLGQGDCGSPASAPSSDRSPQAPCVVSANGRSLDRSIGVVMVEGEAGNAYEVAQLSDGRIRVTEFLSAGLGAGLGASPGAGVTFTINGRTYGGAASVGGAALLGMRGGRVWYTDSVAEAERLVAEANERALEDTLVPVQVRGVWEAGQDLWGAVTGSPDYEFPAADEAFVGGGVILEAGAEATGLANSVTAGLEGAHILGVRTTQDGRTTVYLSTKLQVDGYLQTLGLADDAPRPEFAGGEHTSSVELLTEATFDAGGNLAQVTASVTGAYQNSPLLAGLFEGTLDAETLRTLDFGDPVGLDAGLTEYRATLRPRTSAERAAATAFLASVVAAEGNGAASLVNGSGAAARQPQALLQLYRSTEAFLNQARRSGDVTHQRFTTEDSEIAGVSASGEIGVGLSGGFLLAENSRDSAEAEYWDGSGWSPWTACA